MGELFGKTYSGVTNIFTEGEECGLLDQVVWFEAWHDNLIACAQMT